MNKRHRAEQLRTGGWAYKDIAAELDISSRTVRRWLPSSQFPLTEEQERHIKGRSAMTKRERAREARPAESPGVIWVASDGSFAAARVDLDDWHRFRCMFFQVAGKGYASTNTAPGVKDYLHRMVMGLEPNERWPNGERKVIDHINRDPLDCRKSNLKVCTQKENCANRGGIFAAA